MSVTVLPLANQVIRQFADFPDVDMKFASKSAFETAIATVARIPDGWMAYCEAEKAWYYADKVGGVAIAVKKNYEINILGIGNSFTREYYGYVAYIMQKICPEITVNISIAYLSSASLELHSSNLDSDNPVYYLESYSYSSNSFTSVSGQTLGSILQSKKWDCITFNQLSELSIDYATYQPYLFNLIEDIGSRLGYGVKFGWLMTHSYADGSTPATDIDLTSTEMSNKIIIAVQNLMSDMAVDFVIPVGTAIQNARTNGILDVLGGVGHLSYEGTHLQQGIPCLIAGYTIVLSILKIVGYDFKGITGLDFLPTQEWIDEHGIVGQHGNSVGATIDNVLLAQIASIKAVKNPFKISVLEETYFDDLTDRDAYDVQSLPFYAFTKRDNGWDISKAKATGVNPGYVRVSIFDLGLDTKPALVRVGGFDTSNFATGSVTFEDFIWNIPIAGIENLIGNDELITVSGLTYAPASKQKFIVFYGNLDGTIDFLENEPTRDMVLTIPEIPDNTCILKILWIRDSTWEVLEANLHDLAKEGDYVDNFTAHTSTFNRVFADYMYAQRGIAVGRTDGLGAKEVLFRIRDTDNNGQVNFTIINDDGVYLESATIDRESRVWDFKQIPTLNSVPMVADGGEKLHTVTNRDNRTGNTLFVTGDGRPVASPSTPAIFMEVRNDGIGGKVGIFASYDYSISKYTNTVIGTSNTFGKVSIGKLVAEEKFDVNGNIKGDTLISRGYTVATLPAGTIGMTCYVTDALSPVYLGVVVGGGAVVCKVFFNGTNWIT